MHIRTRQRIHPLLFLVIASLAFYLAMLLVVPALEAFLADLVSFLPRATMMVSFFTLSAIAIKHYWTYADVSRGQLHVRSVTKTQRVELRRLAGVEVLAKHGSSAKRKQFELLLLLTDVDGRRVVLPLNQWRDEDLLMARVLRATVDRKVRIEGDPLLVKRFAKLLETYKSWDRQLAPAA